MVPGVTQERRAARRYRGPFDGGWNGESGQRASRITDVSTSGCFIDSLTNDPPGTPVTVHVQLGGETFHLSGVIAYVDRVQGFAVAFSNNDDATMQAFTAAVTRLDATHETG